MRRFSTMKLKLKYLFLKFIHSVYPTNLLIYTGLLLVSSLSLYITLITNLVIFVYSVKLLRNGDFRNYIIYIISISIGNALTFHIMVAAYAELLPWEVVLNIVFYLVSLYYYYYLFWRNDSNKTQPIFDFKQSNYIHNKM